MDKHMQREVGCCLFCAPFHADTLWRITTRGLTYIYSQKHCDLANFGQSHSVGPHTAAALDSGKFLCLFRQKHFGPAADWSFIDWADVLPLKATFHALGVGFSLFSLFRTGLKWQQHCFGWV